MLAAVTRVRARRRPGQDVDREGILLGLAGAERDGRAQVVLAGRQRGRQREAHGNAFLLARRHGDASCCPANAPGRPSDHSQSHVTVVAGIVDDDDLLLDRFARAGSCGPCS